MLINDFRNENSILRNICSEALWNYKPIREKEVEEKEKRAEEKILTQIPRNEAFYTDDYSLFSDFKVNKSALNPFYLKAAYNWRDNEVPFIRFLEENKNVLWWYKNWDSGRDYFAVKYFDTSISKESLFYPDFIAKLQNWKILIVDTKNWQTAIWAKDRAEWLQKWIKTQKLNIIWWILVNVWWVWMINNNDVYKFDENYSEFKKLVDII